MADAKPPPLTPAERQARRRERYNRMRAALQLIAEKSKDGWAVVTALDALNKEEPK